jgi:hypothetical protein
MNINKAIRKQKKIFKRFMLSMGFIFLALPITLYFAKTFSTFLFIYLGIIEMLILIVMAIRLNRETLKVEYTNKFKIQNGIFREKFMLICDKVEIIHTINEGKNIEIAIIMSSRVRNKRIKSIDSKFLKKNPWANKYYDNFKSINSNKDYFYTVIDKGGYNKYELLDLLYKYCVKAHFTDEAIKGIKEYRN